MEMIVRVTADGIPTGESVSRDCAHAMGIPHTSTHICFINRKGEILLQKRADTKEAYPGQWGLSAAGHIQFGETAKEAAVRECYEEIGIKISQNDLPEGQFFYQKYDNNEDKFHDKEWVTLFTVYKNFSAEKCILQKEEVSSVQWISPTKFSLLVEKQSNDLVPHWEVYRHLLTII